MDDYQDDLVILFLEVVVLYTFHVVGLLEHLDDQVENYHGYMDEEHQEEDE